MGLRRWIIGVLSQGTPPELDEDELVDLEVVPLQFGPITIERLKSAGIDAVAVDAFNAATAQTSTQIKVPRRQVDAATEILDAVR